MGLTDATGQPLHFTPQDFRRMFITDAIRTGPPPHIAEVIAGHANINTTMGYNGIYPTGTIEAHRSFIARRRTLRPAEEYRTPTDAESWATSNAASSPSAPAPAPMARPASTSTPASAAPSCAPTRPSAADWWRSATTSWTGSPRQSRKAGSARLRGSASASPGRNPRSAKSTRLRRPGRSCWGCRCHGQPHHDRLIMTGRFRLTAVINAFAASDDVGFAGYVGW